MAGFKFRRQHPFGDYILDFVCLERKLVVELDGGQHSDQMEADLIRTDKLNNTGFLVLRFWNNEVIKELESVKERIWMELQKGGDPHPHPFDAVRPEPVEGLNGSQDRLNPLPEGEETIS